MSRQILADNCQGQGVYFTEGRGGQLPGGDHGVKSAKPSMSRWILAGNCQGQGVYTSNGGPWRATAWVWPWSKNLKILHVIVY